MVEADSMCYDARIRYWEEEWVSQLLEEAIRLKAKFAPIPEAQGNQIA